MMPTKSNKKQSPPPISTPTYRGPDRRDGIADDEFEVLGGDVSFDVKGDPVWRARVEAQRRRRDDQTIDTLKCLDAESLTLEGEDSFQGEQGTSTGGGYSPYETNHEQLDRATKKPPPKRGE
jgi:hypothetical protein